MQVCLQSFIGGVETYTVPLTNAINIFCNNLIGGVASVIVFTLLGVLGGYFLVKCLVRRNIAKRTFKKYVITNLLDSILNVVIIFTCVWLYTLWKYSIFITIVLAFVIFGATALFEAYLVHGKPILKGREVVNLKNIGKLLATNLIILFMTAVVVGLLILASNIVVGVFIGIALVQIAFVVIGLNAESYVIEIVKTKEQVV